MPKKINKEKDDKSTIVKINFEGTLPDEVIDVIKKSKYRVKIKKIPKDLCKVCDYNLYYDDNGSRRIAITEDRRLTTEVVSWLCPNCFSEFDTEDNLLQLMTKDELGQA